MRFDFVVRCMLRNTVDLSKCFDTANVTDQVINAMTECSQDTLTTMVMPRCCNVSSTGLRALSRCHKLHTLSISNTYLSDSALDIIFSLESLKHLILKDLVSPGHLRVRAFSMQSKGANQQPKELFSLIPHPCRHCWRFVLCDRLLMFPMRRCKSLNATMRT